MIGETRHPLYITFDTPIGNGPYNETCVWLGCTAAKGEYTDQGVFNAIWNKFQSMNVRTRDGRQLGYYAGDSKNMEDNEITNTEYILNHADGRCGSWAHLTKDILNLQGINCEIIGYEHKAIDNYNYYFVRDNITYELIRISQYSKIYQNCGTPNAINFKDHAFNKVTLNIDGCNVDYFFDTTCKNPNLYLSAKDLIEQTIYLEVKRVADNYETTLPAIFEEFQ